MARVRRGLFDWLRFAWPRPRRRRRSRPRASRLAPDTRGPADPIPPFLSLTKQLGTHGRGKKKREEMGELIRKMAAKGRAAA